MAALDSSDGYVQPRKADLEAQDVPIASASRRREKLDWRNAWRWGVVHDALAALSMLILGLGLEKARPRTMYWQNENAWAHAYPLKDNTVPSWTVPLYSLLGPAAVFLSYRWILKRRWWEIIRLIVSLCLAFFLTAAITNCLKLPVGRYRPNFLRACWPNGTVVLSPQDQWGGYPVCDPSVSESDVDEHRKSWPSGHSSLSAAGLGFLTFSLLGQLRAYAPPVVEGRCWRWLVALLPGFGAVAVGVTRVLDYWHYPADVCTGLAIGFLTAFFVYRLQYPALTHALCYLPWELHAELDEHAVRLDERAGGVGSGVLPAVGVGAGNGGVVGGSGRGTELGLTGPGHAVTRP
ncbi:hypothetical protein HYH03_013095 [Edaphochlamys debaryana]|uniref:Phosphatidic acid phosphatase type 2/haloperoxidase domain-containing protein n=1 Tax=Edaphochlamys debaryana TaxID=47281 RepID=A0A836BTC9_9CHLO|nr:hypothetical protein HYH03_013095 [Edaphochlamys debaryana]|eukprot:KAG2488411.1 hypothetical protein HYH03_013095 [Edaphochlamys debaryana]